MVGSGVGKVKSEIRNSKSETNSKSEMQRFETPTPSECWRGQSRIAAWRPFHSVEQRPSRTGHFRLSKLASCFAEGGIEFGPAQRLLRSALKSFLDPLSYSIPRIQRTVAGVPFSVARYRRHLLADMTM
jgi:hypothetical protein